MRRSTAAIDRLGPSLGASQEVAVAMSDPACEKSQRYRDAAPDSIRRGLVRRNACAGRFTAFA